ncbi:MAG TPA: MSMEG_0565 family glycosyltransferase [Actinomycetota bacterium]|nr:MSMEG_0565 family glycosyltransferase [Actinomycetota bacterium]
MTGPRVAIVTYSTKPRGGVVHAMHLAEALHRRGTPVHVIALGDPAGGFFRPLRAPHTVLPAPASAPTLEERVLDAVEALAGGLERLVPGRFDLVHAQDCIAATAGLALRERTGIPLLRTVHHVDDFATPALVECQRRSIVEPDGVLVVSRTWRETLRREFGVRAEVVTNGVDAARFRRPRDADGAPLRRRIGASGRFLFLTVGGIEPRKGSLELVEALARLRRSVEPAPVVAVIGGHSFQDHGPYRERVLERARELDVVLGRDLVLLGTVPDDDVPRWYWAADAFVFPSVKEGFGLALLEALAAGLPVVATDIPVFREFLVPGEHALLTPPGDPEALAEAMALLARDPRERGRLAGRGPALAERYRWDDTARQHEAVYARIVAKRAAGWSRPGP